MTNIQRIARLTCFFAFLLIATSFFLQAQSPPYVDGNLLIESDDDVPSNVTTLTRIQGNLIIGGDITSFPDFSNLEVVEGNVAISTITTIGFIDLPNIFPALDTIYGELLIERNPWLETVSGFAELDSVGGRVRCIKNFRLMALPTFAALTRIEGNLFLNENGKLGTISDFPVLTRVGGGVIISNNNNLTTVSDFPSLTRIEDLLLIQGNAMLATVSGFDALTHAGNNLTIKENATIGTISGFMALTHIGNDFNITNNGMLGTISGFMALTHIGNNFNITNNGKLGTISGFDAITTILGGVNIEGNMALSSCCGLTRLIDGSSPASGTTNISNNTTGCNDLVEVYADCVRRITASTLLLAAEGHAGVASFSITADLPWGITKKDEDTWITAISPDEGDDNQDISITYTANPKTTERMAILTLSATRSRVGLVKDIHITLTQAGATNDSPSSVLGLPAAAKGMRFFPNPAANTLYIEGITQKTSLIIQTFSGKSLLRASLHQNQAIDLAALPQGVYLLTLQSSQESAQEKITRRLVIGL